MKYSETFTSKYQNFMANDCTYHRFISYMVGNLRHLKNRII